MKNHYFLGTNLTAMSLNLELALTGKHPIALSIVLAKVHLIYDHAVLFQQCSVCLCLVALSRLVNIERYRSAYGTLLLRAQRTYLCSFAPEYISVT
jgi:hypothetical protein